jgi:hypothetical protein
MELKGLPMTRETRTRAGIAVLIYSMASGVLFGAGLILVLTLPVLNANAGFWISVVVGASFILAAPIAWWMAPRLRARYWRRRVTAAAMMSEPFEYTYERTRHNSNIWMGLVECVVDYARTQGHCQIGCGYRGTFVGK